MNTGLQPRAHRRDLEGMASANALSDVALLDAVALGDDTHMLVLMERHMPAIHALAARMVGRDDADDIAQESMLRLWQKSDELEIDARGVRPWLYRVASNLCLDHLRKRREITGDDMPERKIEPEQDRHMGEQQMSAIVETAMSELPERQKLALMLFHIEDLSQRETAEIMDVSEDALESLLRRARVALKKKLKDGWEDLIPEAGSA